MKKIFNLILAALVIIGAASCTKNEEVAYQGGEGLSFYAEIVNGDTRAYIDDTDGDKVWNTIWENGDVISVSYDRTQWYDFAYNEVTNKFTCTADGVTSLLGQLVSVYPAANMDSKVGKKGWSFNGIQTVFTADMTIEITADTSFFRYTYNGDKDITFTVTADKKVFVVDEVDTDTVTFAAGEVTTPENFVAFWPNNGDNPLNATLSYSIGGVKCKETTIDLYPGKVYNLGTLTVPEWGIAGSHNTWTAAPMYYSKGCYVALGVPAGTEFKFKKNDIWKGVVTADANVSANTWTYFNNGSSNITLPTENAAYDIYMNRANGVFCVVKSGEKVSDYVVPTGKAIYLNGGGSGLWDQGNAHFDAWAWPAGGEGAWYVMADVEDGIYRCIVPSNVDNAIFIRRSSASPRGSWEGSDRWNKTGDLEIPADKNLYTITGWGESDGNWSTK